MKKVVQVKGSSRAKPHTRVVETNDESYAIPPKANLSLTSSILDEGRIMGEANASDINDKLEFGTVFSVNEKGELVDLTRTSIVSPEEIVDYDDWEHEIGDWEAVSGYSGQHGYSGPIMHQSEFLGGGMARDLVQEAKEADEAGEPIAYTLAIVEAENPEDEYEERELVGWLLLKKKI